MTTAREAPVGVAPAQGSTTFEINPKATIRTTLPWAVAALVAAGSFGVWMHSVDTSLKELERSQTDGLKGVVDAVERLGLQVEKQGNDTVRRSELRTWIELSRAHGLELPDLPPRD